MVRKCRLMILALMVILMGTGVVFAGSSEITQQDIDAGLQFCKEYPVSMELDGKAINSDVSPVIIKERTLIPARAVFESMGGSVNWNEDARVVEVSLGTSSVKLTIDSKIAFVNGEQVTMEVPAMIINDRTVIPIRFVAESLACNVGWDQDTRTVKINAPAKDDRISVNAINVENQSDKYRVVVTGDDIIGTYKSFAYDSPDRFGIDIKSATLSVNNSSITAGNEIFSVIRYSQYEQDTVRLVVDLKQKVAGKVSLSDDKKSIYIDFDKSQASNNDNLGDVTADGLNVLDWRVRGKLIVIDPGHGGKDTGSQAIQNGVTVLNEKDVNLDVATRLNKMLQAAGANTYMLREGDTSISLYGRPELANNAGGIVYICIHNNSSESPSAHGTEVFYDSKSNESDYGIYSKDLAEQVSQELQNSLGITNRGAKSEPAYAVLNKTKMPAIIIEGAFLSNAGDLKLLLTDEFRQNYAYGVAKALIQVLNDSVDEQ